MSRPKIRTENLDMETVVSIKRLCADYGMRLSHYYDHSNLNAPQDGHLSYLAFLAAVAGGTVTPEQEARVARSLGVVRSALRKLKRQPVMQELRAGLTTVAAVYEEDPAVFAPGELRTLRRVIGRALKRCAK